MIHAHARLSRRATRRRQARAHLARRKGFALMFVVMLSFVAAIALAVMVERQMAQTMSVQRQVSLYETRHLERGLAEAVETWVRSLGTAPLVDNLGENGLAFEISPQGEPGILVYFEDAQGTALDDLTALQGLRYDFASRILDELAARAKDQAVTWTRRLGPVAISANSAREEVLDAVVATCCNPGNGKTIPGEIIRARAAEPLTPVTLDQVIINSGVTPEEQNALRKALTASPILWTCRVEPTDNSLRLPGQRLRYSGVVLSSGGDRDGLAGFQRRVSVLEMKREQY